LSKDNEGSMEVYFIEGKEQLCIPSNIVISPALFDAIMRTHLFEVVNPRFEGNNVVLPLEMTKKNE